MPALPMAVRVTIVASPGEPELSLVLDGERVALGRAEGADVRLPDPSVSPRHASLRAHGGAWLLVDHGSTNGTWIGGVRLGPEAARAIASGELVRLGRVWLRVETNVHAPASTREDTRDLAMRLVARAMTSLGEDARARVRCVAGPDAGKEAPVPDAGALVLGRGADAGLVLTEPLASRRHAEIAVTGGRPRVRDLGAKHGSSLDGAPLAPCEWTAWRPGQALVIGDDELELLAPVVGALAELSGGSDEVMKDPGAVAPPPTATPAPEPAPGEWRESRLTERPPERARRGGGTAWDPGDAMLVVFALLVVAASVAGLLWVLRA